MTRSSFISAVCTGRITKPVTPSRRPAKPAPSSGRRARLRPGHAGSPLQTPPPSVTSTPRTDKKAKDTGVTEPITPPPTDPHPFIQRKYGEVYDQSGAYIGPTVVYAADEIDAHREEADLFHVLDSIDIDTPVFPHEWARNFTDLFIPGGLFEPDGAPQPTPIYAHKRTLDDQFKATRRIIGLISLTEKVVGLSSTGQHDKITEYIRRELELFMTWAEEDTDCNDFQSFYNLGLSAMSTKRKESRRATVNRVLLSLRSRAQGYRDFLFLEQRECGSVAFKGAFIPLLYTVVIKGGVVTVYTIDPKATDDHVHELININFAEKGQALWNAIRVATILCRARDQLLQIAELIPRQSQLYIEDDDI